MQPVTQRLMIREHISRSLNTLTSKVRSCRKKSTVLCSSFRHPNPLLETQLPKLLREPRALAWLLLLIIIGSAVVKESLIAYRLTDLTSPIADSFSEANSVRAAESYIDRGFTFAAGLQAISYGARFPDTGYHHARGDDFIYTHYPPGPDYLVGLATMVFGKGEVSKFRAIPLFVGAMSLVFLAFISMAFWGPFGSVVFVGTLLLIPMSTNMMHGLHYQGYAMNLLFIQLGIMLETISKRDRNPGHWKVSLFILGVLQGYLSFDHFYLVALGGVPAVLLSGTAGRERLRLLAVALIPGLGFVFAHLLHFLQVILFHGSAVLAYKDLLAAAIQRSGVTSTISMSEVLRSYWFDHLPTGRYLDFPVWILGVFALILVSPPVSLPIWTTGNKRLQLVWRPTSKANLMAIGAALFISSLWIFTMREHAFDHRHFIPRHYILFCFYVIAATIRAGGYKVVMVGSDARRQSDSIPLTSGLTAEH